MGEAEETRGFIHSAILHFNPNKEVHFFDSLRLGVPMKYLAQNAVVAG